MLVAPHARSSRWLASASRRHAWLRCFQWWQVMQSSGACRAFLAFCSRWHSTHQPIVSGGGAGLKPTRYRRSTVSDGPVSAAKVVIVSTGPWHPWHLRPARMWALWGKYVNSGSLFTRTQGIDSFFAWYSASFLISGLSAAAILWHPMQRSTDGSPAYSERRASL